MYESAQAFCKVMRFPEYPGESYFETMFEPLKPPAFRRENEKADTEEKESLEYWQEQSEYAEHDENSAEYEAEQSFKRYWHGMSAGSFGYGYIDFVSYIIRLSGSFVPVNY